MGRVREQALTPTNFFKFSLRSKYRQILIKNREISEDGCWLWKGSISGTGYGVIRIPELKRSVLVHRLSTLLFKPKEFEYYLHSPECQVNHNCNVKKCFNPNHIYTGTAYDNTRDMWIEKHWKTEKEKLSCQIKKTVE